MAAAKKDEKKSANCREYIQDMKALQLADNLFSI